jgi:hypothetical protein
MNMETGVQDSNLTYAAIDCSGVKEIGLTADVELSRDLCIPVDDKGVELAKGTVSGTIHTTLENWNDLVASVTFPAFAIKGLDGFVWNLQDAVFDFSDLRNDPAFSIPRGYSDYLPQGNENLWRGVYVKDLSVTLPKPFNAENDKRVSFGAHDLLIDENGVTGLFTATNVLSFEHGNASGWAFSVNEFGLDLLANRLNGATFAGEIGLPTSEKARLKYDGQITADDQYILQVNTIDTIAFDVLQARAELLPNSYIKMTVEDGRFKPEALLHGRMGITAMIAQKDSAGKKIAEFKGVEFRSLHLQTQNPYLSVEYLGYKGDVKLLGLPVSVSDISLTAGESRAALHFNLNMALMKNDLRATTGLTIAGEMDQTGGRQHWHYANTDVSAIKVDAMIAETFKLKGELELLSDDPTYGDGFRGQLHATFGGKLLKGLDVEMRGMFGYKGYRYWFMDGIARLSGNGLLIGPSFFLNGFGGGLTYRMAPSGLTDGSGLSATSMTYLPDDSRSLGIKASVAFCVGSKSMANGEATFDLSFNKNGGLSYAGFYGFAKIASHATDFAGFEKEAAGKYQKQVDREQKYIQKHGNTVETLTKYKQYDPQEAAKIASGKDAKALGTGGLVACVGIQYNFDESSFDANFDLYANLVGGLIRGVGVNNRAGYAVLHIDPHDWYMYMGTPTDRIGLRMGFGSILSVKTGSYLMAGTKIPATTGVPEQVASILGYEPADLDYMGNLSQLGDGKGFAFGSSLNIDTGDLSFLILYARYSAGLGFDIMLKDYGDAQCKGHDGAIGINGWYANGQAYAYMSGELGVRISLFFIKKKIPIFKADIAALMQAKLPNPASFKAYLAVRAKVLGILSVNCRFKILIGDDCQLLIPGGSPLDMAMITDLAPADNTGDVSVFAAPQATLQTAADKPFVVNDDEGEKTYRIRVKDFSLTNDSITIAGGLRWNDTHDAVSFYSDEVLPPEKEVTATIRINFEELQNGRWNPVYTAGKEAIESKTVHFHTGDAPTDIPMQNVAYTYPVVGQKYYLKGESRQGYIQLKRGQTYLFPENLKNQVVYEEANGTRQSIDFRYNVAQRRIDYTMPEVANSSSYTVTVASLSNGTNADTSSGDTLTSVIDGGEDGNITLSSHQATTATRTDIGKTLLTYDFATSSYNTFQQKMQALKKDQAGSIALSSNLLMFAYSTTHMEPFDLADLTGTEQTGRRPLIDVAATLDDDFYRKQIYPLIYDGYPIGGRFRVTRSDADSIGVPPVKALPLRNDYLNGLQSNDYSGLTTRLFPYYYNLPSVYQQDFVDLQNQIVNALLGTSTSSFYDRFLLGVYPMIPAGRYTIRLQYVMPGGVKGTQAKFDYKNVVL